MRMRARAGLGAVITVVAIGLAASPTAAEAMPSTLYVFGDSLSDNGNLYAYTGQANPATGGLAIPVAPPYAQGRFTNGPTYAERLWDALGFAGDLAPALLGGTNYAVGGARSRYHTFDARQYSVAFNQAIDAALQSVAGTPDLELLRFDAFGLLDRVAQDPAANGFTNIADACLQGLYLAPTPGAPAPTVCSNPDQYLFWDIVHPSASAHAILGRELYGEVRTAFVPEPASLLLLLAAVLALVVSRRRGWTSQAMMAA